MASFEFPLHVPKWFRLKTVVTSHGWYDLPPFQWDESAGALHLTANLSHRIVDLSVHQNRKGAASVQGAVKGRAGAALMEQSLQAIERVLGLAIDVSEFYQSTGPDYAWARDLGAGALLAAPTVFEDAVKMLATTNCSWSLTRQMVSRLVDRLGEPGPSGRRAFPTADQMAKRPLEFYRDEVRAGYRARYFKELSEQVADGRLAPEAWRQHDGPYADLLREIRRAPGLGRYAAENLAKLVGRFDGLAIDSWCTKKFVRVRGPVRGDVAKAIERHYARFGQWKGLALWLDLTRDWHQVGVESDPTVVLKKY